MTKTIKEADLDLPSDLMRQRHPEQFSDSGERIHPTLERSRLEYHLEALTRDASLTAELTTLTDRLSDISKNYIS